MKAFFPLLTTLLFAFALLFFDAQGISQTRNQAVYNIQYSAQANQLIINFDLKPEKGPLQVGLYLLDKDLKAYKAMNVVPEGNQLFAPGQNHQLIWNIPPDINNRLEKTFIPLLVPGNVSDYNPGPGYEAAALSILIPGLGDYYMGGTSDQLIKPYMRTISALGLLALGIDASQQRTRNEPSLFFDERTQQWKKWKLGEWNYRYFRNDAELLISAGIAVWLADIVWVAIRGHKNNKIRRNLNTIVIDL